MLFKLFKEIIFLHDQGLIYKISKSDLYEYIGLPISIIKSEEDYSEILNIEEKRSLTKERAKEQNIILHAIYKQIRENINPNIRFDFKDFYDFYITKRIDPRSIRKKRN